MQKRQVNSMAGHIQLTPEELIAQSERMMGLKEQYNTLFQDINGILNTINTSWSENLSNNFSGKLSSAQKSFEKITDLLQIGSDTARNSASGFQSIDQVLATSDLSKFLEGFGKSSGSSGAVQKGSSGRTHSGGSGKSFKVFDLSALAQGGFGKGQAEKFKQWVYDASEGTIFDPESDISKWINGATVAVFEDAVDSDFFKRTNEIAGKVSDAAEDGNYIKAAAIGAVGVVETTVNATVDVVLDKGLGAIGKTIKKLGGDVVLEYTNLNKLNDYMKDTLGWGYQEALDGYPDAVKEVMTETSEKTMEAIDSIFDAVADSAKYVRNIFVKG